MSYICQKTGYVILLILYAEFLLDYTFYYDLPESTIAGGIDLIVNNRLQRCELAHYKIISSPVNEVENT